MGCRAQYHLDYSIWALEPHPLSPWTLRDSFRRVLFSVTWGKVCFFRLWDSGLKGFAEAGGPLLNVLGMFRV